MEEPLVAFPHLWRKSRPFQSWLFLFLLASLTSCLNFTANAQNGSPRRPVFDPSAAALGWLAVLVTCFPHSIVPSVHVPIPSVFPWLLNSSVRFGALEVG